MKRRQKKLLIRIIISLSLFLIAFIFDKVYGIANIIDNKNSWLLAFGVYLLIYLIIGYDVLIKAIKGLFYGRMLDENFLMAVATIGAFSLAIYKGCTHQKDIDGFDEACAVLLFYQVGEFCQSYAIGKSRKSISSLMDIRPDLANVERDNEIITVDPSEVLLDEIIVVNPGEKIPLDGIVVDGVSALDTKALTGEGLPRDVATGDNVISGTVNLISTIKIKVTKVFYDSTVSKILDMVENATNKKSKAENFISKFAKYYTPIVVFLALAIAIIPSLITRDWNIWLYRGLSFLVVSCPCALVISIPLSFFAGIGAASKHGILIKGSNYLEKFNKANIFVFDKTGTLTKGNFKVTKIYPEESRDEILKYAAYAEYSSSHPIGLSILSEYKGEIDTSYTLTNIAGYGIEAKGDHIILCGNYKLMENNNISCDIVSEIGSILYVAVDNKYLGYILINDEIKNESYELIDYFNKNNIKSVMLTGDNERVASSVASNIGLSSYKAGLLPQDKVNEIESLLSNKKDSDVLAFVGDGINDAPSLVRSDIGISMGAVGSDAAIEASDIVLMHDDLSSIRTAKKISKKTMGIVFQNIIFAIAVKVIILILSAFGIANMWIAIFGDVGVALICIINALRVNSKYR